MQKLFVLAVLAVLAGAPAQGAPLPPDKLPSALREWSGWVLAGHEKEACPSLGENDASCVWPSRLELSLEARAGRFTQGFRVVVDEWVPLPGDARHWPQDVKVDGQAAAVVPSGDRPGTWLKAGDHVISGTFAWSALPESLPVPARTALLSLSLNGRAVPSPSRDASGLLWLQRDESGDEADEARLDVTVHRLVADEVPLLLTTKVKLDVAGKSREVLLGRALPAGFAALSISGDLPARLEPDGRLRVQVRPGSWNIEVIARHEGPVDAITLEKQEDPWATQEAWVFDARPEIRVATVEGVPAIDPSQTTLPEEWKQMPAWRVAPGDAFKLVEQQRGDADLQPEKLSLSRTLWLDFDGGGWTVRDQMSGALTRSWRLAMNAPTQLGHVSVDGKDQLVTRSGEGAPGLEIRQGHVSLLADSRLEGARATIPAVGWDLDFHSVSGALELPPGWRLLHASGVDTVTTWVRRWTLLDIFLVLVLAVAFGRIFGRTWGLVALATLALTFPEAGAPRWAWLAPLAFEALVRVVKAGKLSNWLATGRLAAWVILAFALVPFAVHHVRLGLYPTLERPWGSVDDGVAAPLEQTVFETAAGDVDSTGGSRFASPAGNAYEGGEAMEEPQIAQKADWKANAVLGMKTKDKARMMKRSISLDEIAVQSNSGNTFGYTQRLNLVDNDPKAIVQTGPGVPKWSWQRVQLGWSGPVARTQELTLWLLSPTTNLVLAFLRVGLLALLLVVLIRRAGASPAASTPLPSAPVVASTIAIFVVFGAIGARAEIPPSDLLDQLREKLTAPPDCGEECLSSSRLFVEATGTTLRLRQEISAAATVPAALPGGLEHWTPDRVLVDGQPAKALARDDEGTLFVLLTAGAHVVQLEGTLTRESVQVPLPLRPRRVDTKVTGWAIDGVHDDGEADEALQLTREAKAGVAEPARGLEAGTLPPFVRVQRALLLGLDWTVETTVSRITPPGTPVVLEVPLLPGESIVSAEVRQDGGRAFVNMGPRTGEVSWRSVLPRTPTLELEAPKTAAWTEVWRLEASPVWHVERSGIPSIHAEPTSAARIPEWRPWPGEKLALVVTRPEAVQGATVTMQEAALTVTPGLRTSDATLTFTLSASRGTQAWVELPEGATLQSISTGGRTLPPRQDGRRAAFPVSPGTNAVVVTWRDGTGISPMLRTPTPVVLVPDESDPKKVVALSSVNVRVSIAVPDDRWLLAAGGPDVGPAVLFWSTLLVLILVALGLSRITWSPLKTHQWVLLGLGLTQVPLVGAAFVAAWLVAIAWRERKGAEVKSWGWFNLGQLALVGATLVSLGILFESIRVGLLVNPDMQVQGNGSEASILRWFADRADGALPGAWMLSLPRMAYRALMLAWSLWLAVSLLKWLAWGWKAFATGGLWREIPMSPEYRLRKEAEKAVPAPKP